MLFRVWAYARFAKGGPTSGALGELYAVKHLVARGVATRVLGGFGCMLPREIFLIGTIWCILEHIFINF